MLYREIKTLLGILRHPGSVFYGWWIVVAGTVAAVVYSAVYAVGFGAYFLPLAQEFSSGRMALSGVYSLVHMESGLLSPIQGYLLDKLGPRTVMRVGYLLFGLGFVLLSRVHSLQAFYALFALAAVGATLSGFLTVSVTVVNWFFRLRGLTLGIAMSGTSLGGVLVPVLTWSIASFGWRATLLGIGIFLWMVGIPLSSAMRHRPEQYGTVPDGQSGPLHLSSARLEEGGVPILAEEQNFTIVEALKTQAFWLMGIAHALSVMVWSSVMVHQIPALVEIGVSQTVAATVMSVTAGVMAVGRLIGGVVGDLLGRKPALLVCYLMQSAGLVVLALVGSLWQAYIFAVLVGLGFGARGPLLVAMRGDYFGRRAFATISGVMETLITTGAVIAPLFAGYVYDARGSYSFAFLSIAAASLVGALLILIMRSPVLGRASTGA